MSKRDSIIFIAVALMLIFGLYLAKKSAKNSYQNEIENLSKFEVEAKSLARLKSTIGDDKDKRVILSLNRIKAPSKDIKKSDSHIYLYENLSLNTLSSMLRKIQNSTLIIKKLEIKRESDNSANLRLEIGK